MFHRKLLAAKYNMAVTVNRSKIIEKGNSRDYMYGKAK